MVPDCATLMPKFHSDMRKPHTMNGDSFRELRKLSTTWHDEANLLRDMATRALSLLEKHNLTVMANTYLVCASALDECLGESLEAEAPQSMAQNA